MKAPINFRAPSTARNLHARHVVPDYDEHAKRAIAILREVDECLLTEGARRFTSPEVFVANAFLLGMIPKCHRLFGRDRAQIKGA